MKTKGFDRCFDRFSSVWGCIISKKMTGIFLFFAACFFSFSSPGTEQTSPVEFQRHFKSLTEQYKFLSCIVNELATFETKSKNENRRNFSAAFDFLKNEKKYILNKIEKNVTWFIHSLKSIPENQRLRFIFRLLSVFIEGCDPFYEGYLREQVHLVLIFDRVSNEIKKIREDEITGKKVQENNVYLTFDDGPLPGKTDRILDILKKYNIKASFFLLGKKITAGKKKAENLIRRIKGEGHVIGHHSMNHRVLDADNISMKELEEEITTSKFLIEKIIGKKVRYFRSPYGRRNLKVLEILDWHHHKHILWNIDSLDWRKDMSPGKIVDRVVRLLHLYEGGIVLFHDSPGKAASFLPDLLEKLVPGGFLFYTVDKLN